MNFKQQFIFYSQSIIGMIISHYIPSNFFYFWVLISLYIGHLINKKNYEKRK